MFRCVFVSHFLLSNNFLKGKWHNKWKHFEGIDLSETVCWMAVLTHLANEIIGML